MDFLISNAWAQAADGQPSPVPSLVMLVVLFALFYFMFIRPQQKRAKEHRNMVSERWHRRHHHRGRRELHFPGSRREHRNQGPEAGGCDPAAEGFLEEELMRSVAT